MFMRMISRFVAVSQILIMTACVAAAAQSRGGPTTGPNTKDDDVQGQAWWAHVRYLADDSMKGRLIGTDDYLKAAAYVVDKFKSWGLKPAGVDGTYYQPVQFDVQRVIAKNSSMALVKNGK